MYLPRSKLSASSQVYSIVRERGWTATGDCANPFLLSSDLVPWSKPELPLTDGINARKDPLQPPLEPLLLVDPEWGCRLTDSWPPTFSRPSFIVPTEHCSVSYMSGQEIDLKENTNRLRCRDFTLLWSGFDSQTARISLFWVVRVTLWSCPSLRSAVRSFCGDCWRKDKNNQALNGGVFNQVSLILPWDVGFIE